ncbi:Uncharacterized protein Adt_20984 [Abeliophyllum distichum]|uniref:Transposase MuDR plant domain-containing protein n=1 Tax=Abeliophyllum distichum TaxID=126358 RepID=A0ABD1SY69_9LAMI
MSLKALKWIVNLCKIEGTESLECEVDDLECPSSEELISEYSTDNETEYRFLEFDVEIDMKNLQLEVGKIFRSLDEFKDAVWHYGVMNRFNIRFKVNDPKRVHVVCKLGSKWRVWASKINNSSTKQIKSFTP